VTMVIHQGVPGMHAVDGGAAVQAFFMIPILNRQIFKAHPELNLPTYEVN